MSYHDYDPFNIDELNGQYLHQMGPEKFYETMDLENWIRRSRKPSGGVLDIGATAIALGLDVDMSYDGLPDGCLDETDPSRLVARINRGLPETMHRFVFGHEAGHLFMRSVTRRGGNAEEDLCELVGGAMAIPAHELTPGLYDEQAVREVMQRYQTAAGVTLLTLMHRGHLPRKLTLTQQYYRDKVEDAEVCLNCTLHQPCRVEEPQPADSQVHFDFTDVDSLSGIDECRAWRYQIDVARQRVARKFAADLNARQARQEPALVFSHDESEL